MRDDVPLLDTNTILRHVLHDHDEQSPRATALFARLDAQELTVRVLDQALFEAAFTMMKSYGATRAQVKAAILQLVELPAVLVRNKDAWRATFDVFLAHTKLSLVDSFHVVMSEKLDASRVISFDQDFDRVPGVTRIEP